MSSFKIRVIKDKLAIKRKLYPIKYLGKIVKLQYFCENTLTGSSNLKYFSF